MQSPVIYTETCSKSSLDSLLKRLWWGNFYFLKDDSIVVDLSFKSLFSLNFSEFGLEIVG